MLLFTSSYLLPICINNVKIYGLIMSALVLAFINELNDGFNFTVTILVN